MQDTNEIELIADIREQLSYLQELGVDGMEVELPEQFGHALATDSAETKPKERPAVGDALPKLAMRSDGARKPGSRLAALPSLKNRPPAPNVWEGQEDEHEPQRPTFPVVRSAPVLPEMEKTTDTIESIRSEIGDCTRCALHTQGRKQIVHTTGNFDAELMFIGEAPGADEDVQGFPFVGRAGQLLTKIIESIGMKREDVCIGNINRCRPPENRKPEPAETEACRPFILREIAVVKPKVVVVLGATAAHNLLQVKTPISKLRGHFHDYFGVKVMPTFHPAYLLRDPHKKREVWEDMKKVREMLRSSV